MTKDDLTQAHEAATGTTKRETADGNVEHLLEHYRAMVGDTSEPRQTVLEDLLADLMHWAATPHDDDPIDFDEAFRVATMHFDLESDDPDDEEDDTDG